METDKKIEKYLERARKIYNKNTEDYNFFTLDCIAKMIQLEEHRDQK